MKPRTVRTLALIILTANTLLNSGFTSFPTAPQPGQRSESGMINLPVKPIAQRKVTSCGEAAITMAYNYMYPQGPLEELDVVAFAMTNGYYVDNHPPFTSPVNMVKIAEHYVSDQARPAAHLIQTGQVSTPEQGLQLLFEHLQNGEPVIIDVLTQLGNRYSGAHFVLVTGMSQSPAPADGMIIFYNDPRLAHNESAPWSGPDGVWNAWQTNGDPGGAGWWLVIPHSAPARFDVRFGR